MFPFLLDRVDIVDLTNLTRKLSIEQEYNELGGAAGILGEPLDGEKQGAKGGKYREYKKGAIYWHPDIGAYEVHGDILEKYKSKPLQAESGILGYPTTRVRQGTDNGYYSVFEGGAILWKPLTIPLDPEFKKISAYEVHGNILTKYKEMKAYAGPLGYPITDELDTDDGKGKVNYFYGGAIYWTLEGGAHEVHDVIYKKYRDLGEYNGILGYPVTDEWTTPDGIGRFNHFEKGSIYWTNATGAHEVHGPFRDKWESMGWETGWLGYPTSDVFSIPGTNGKRSIFVGGAIDRFPGKNAEAIQHFYDLKALDWRFKLNSPAKPTTITFYAVVANVGTQVVTGPGDIIMVVYWSRGYVDAIPLPFPSQANIPADFKLNPGDTVTLDPGVTVPFGEHFKYSCLVYYFNITGEPIGGPNLLDDLKTGKNNNGLTFFVDREGADVGEPKEPRTGGWIKRESGKYIS